MSGIVRMLAIVLALAATPALARDALGLFGAWGAFSDPAEPRCYAIAEAEPSDQYRDFQPYADVAWWPKKAVRGQVHFRLSRKPKPDTPITLAIGGQRFALVGGGGDAWAADKAMDAAVIAAMRNASSMTVRATGADGKLFTDSWPLKGAATAMDAAMMACAPRR